MGRGLAPNGKIYYLSLSINPVGQTGASRSASGGVCKRERVRLREDWVLPRGREKDVKGHEGWREQEQWGEIKKMGLE